MGMMYAWATKEYILWQMSLGQLFMYHNLGMEIKYPQPEGAQPSIKNLSPKDAAAVRDDARRIFQEAQQEESDARKAEFIPKYGAV